MAAHPNFCFDHSLVFNLSLLRDKAEQLQSLATMLFAQTQTPSMPTTPVNMENVAGLLQEIIVIVSNVMFTCQNDGNPTNVDDNTHENMIGFDQTTQLNAMFEWSGGGAVENSLGSVTCNTRNDDSQDRHMGTASGQRSSPKNYDIVEMDAADLLAKYTHYCQVCGKGFKRDANLRMHMRAHGEEYKSTAALANPIALNGCTSARKYSCPQEGCRWNRKHVKFQPLKSMICMKNHYKRSHCPKTYTCKRCHQKQFSVLSDLRTHEKHCGDVKWRCSCGTTFSRKDKLMGHVGLFLGHAPVADEI